ncbi:MAG: hypothetical protein WC796_03070 [Candidatus Pacearchaeota archaeon]|jgi:hypothetical protein
MTEPQKIRSDAFDFVGGFDGFYSVFYTPAQETIRSMPSAKRKEVEQNLSDDLSWEFRRYFPKGLEAIPNSTEYLPLEIMRRLRLHLGLSSVPNFEINLTDPEREYWSTELEKRGLRILEGIPDIDSTRKETPTPRISTEAGIAFILYGSFNREVEKAKLNATKKAKAN